LKRPGRKARRDGDRPAEETSASERAAERRRSRKGAAPKAAKPRAGLASAASAAVAAASRWLTPTRGLLLAAVGCAVLLGLSQFADYRGIAIGVDAYDPEVSAVAPAPEVDRRELGTAHSYLMVPAAVIAIGILIVAVRRRRWQLCRLAALIGLAAIVVSFLVDRPIGLDEGSVARNFAGAEAQLLGGFWVQVFAGIGLLVTSLMLGAELRREGGERSSAVARRPRRSSKSSRSRRPRTGSGASPGAAAGAKGAEGAGA